MKCNFKRVSLVGLLGLTLLFGNASLIGAAQTSQTATSTEVATSDSLSGAGVMVVLGDCAETADATATASKAETDSTTAQVEENISETTTTANEVNSVIAEYENLGIANVENQLNIRETADENAEVVGILEKNAGCNIISSANGWSQIESGDVTGYVKTDFLLTGEEANQVASQVMITVATVNTDTLYVRAEASTDASVLSMAANGEDLKVVDQSTSGWVKVSSGDAEGYVSADFVTMTNTVEDALSASEMQYGEGVSDVGASIVEYALQFVGNPYVWGGTSLTNGADCSGFTLSLMANYGVYLPHSAAAQSGMGTEVSASEAQPGDLFFYSSGGSVNHVAMYIGGGQVVHASSAKTGIKVSNAFYRDPVTVRRFL